MNYVKDLVLYKGKVLLIIRTTLKKPLVRYNFTNGYFFIDSYKSTLLEERVTRLFYFLVRQHMAGYVFIR